MRARRQMKEYSLYHSKIVVNLSLEESVNELQYIHTMACCIVVKMNKIQFHVTAWISDIMSEKGKNMSKTTSRMIPFRKLEIKQDHKPYTA